MQNLANELKAVMTPEMNAILNTRINDLIKAGAKKHLMVNHSMTEQEANEQLITEAICTLIGA
jgi:flagellar biosynthesis/type III secretory pathway chaperone